MVLGKLAYRSGIQKNETGPLSYTIHKNIFKMDEIPNVRQDTIKILEENTGNDLFDLGHCNFLLDMSPEARETKAKTGLLQHKHPLHTKLKGSLQNKRCLQMIYWIKG